MNSSPILYVDFQELCECAAISEQQILALIEQEIITPASGQVKEEWQFAVTSISIANKAGRIHSELVVDWEDVPLILTLLDEIETLRNENVQLKSRLDRFLDN
jgi:chaperone modulatory protein CbpM